MSFTYEDRLNFTYETKRAVPISEVVESLQALEKVLYETPRLLNTLVPEFDIVQAEILLEKVEAGSLIEDLIVTLVFGSKEGMEQWGSRVRQQIGIDNMQGRNPLLGTALSLLLAGGAGFAISKMFGKDAPKESIEQHNSVLLRDCVIQFNVSEEIAAGAFEAVQNKTNVASNVCKIMRPLRAEEGGNLLVNGNEQHKITQKELKEIPLKVSKEDAQSGSESHTNVVAIIRAMDLDKRTSGWAATFPDLSERRIKVKIDPSIEPRTLLRSDGVMVDVTLDYRFDKEGKKIFKSGTIEKLIPSSE